MRFNVEERRLSVHLAGVIDEALDLAEVRGWRYALAYLISEQVPSPIIQRLLSGGGQIRRTPSELRPGAPLWKGCDAEDMDSLFNWLRERRETMETCECDGAPRASRSGTRQPENN